jgi:hypothetical protein
VEIGEIKSSNEATAIKKGYRQLLLRLAVLSHVIEGVIRSDEDDTKEIPKYSLIGKIYVPKTSQVLISPEWDKGIKFSSLATYRVDIMKIGEKQ